MTRSLAALVVATLALAGCAITSRDARTELPGTSWVLVEVDGEPAEGDPPPSLTFGEDGTVTGSTGCNTFNGEVTIDGSDLEFGPLMTTRMACTDPALADQESTFLLTLDEATGSTIDGDGRLVITGSDTELVFEVAPEAG